MPLNDVDQGQFFSRVNVVLNVVVVFLWFQPTLQTNTLYFFVQKRNTDVWSKPTYSFLFFYVSLIEAIEAIQHFTGVFPLNNPSISQRYNNEKLDQNDCCQESLKSSCLTFLAHLKCVPLGPSGINRSYAVLCPKLHLFAHMLPVLQKDFRY